MTTAGHGDILNADMMENLLVEKFLRRLTASRRSSKRLLITALGLVLVIASVSVFVRKSAPLAAKQPAVGPPVLSVGGNAGVDSCRFLTVSSDGSVVGAISAGGVLHVFDWQGQPVFSAPLKTHNRAALAPGGKFTLLYSHRDLSNTSVTFLDSSGREHSSMDVGSAVWSADGVLTDGGVRFAIGTGAGMVYIVDLSRSGRRHKRWRVPGAVVSVSMDSDGQQVNYGCWQRSVVGCATWSGEKRWEEKTDPSVLNYVERLSASRTACVLVPNRSGSAGSLWIMRGDGEKLWETKVGQSARPKAVIAKNGRYVCRSYSRAIRHERNTVVERHGVLVESPGKTLWDKGSLFFQADPLFVTSSGYVVVVGSKNRLYILSRTGEVKPSLELPSRLRLAVSVRNGAKLVIYCSDGSIHMLDLTEQQPRHSIEAAVPTRLG